jgi:hypothetical protein
MLISCNFLVQGRQWVLVLLLALCRFAESVTWQYFAGMSGLVTGKAFKRCQ